MSETAMRVGQMVQILDCLTHQGEHDRKTGEVIAIEDEFTIGVKLPTGEVCLVGDWRSYEEPSDKEPRAASVQFTKEPEPQPPSPESTMRRGRPKGTGKKDMADKPVDDQLMTLSLTEVADGRVSLIYKVGRTTIELQRASVADIETVLTAAGNFLTGGLWKTKP